MATHAHRSTLHARLLGAALGAFALLAGIAATAEAAPVRGVALHSNWYWDSGGASDSQLATEIDKADSMNADVVRLMLPWNSLEPTSASQSNTAFRNRIDTMMTRIGNRQMKAVVTVIGTPCWASASPSTCQASNGTTALTPPAQASSFGGAVGRIIDRWGSRIAAVEVWNEPYLDDSFKGTPVQYAGLVNAAAVALGSRSWNGELLAAAVPPGAPPYGSDWLDRLYDAGMSGHDAITLHAYDFEWNDLEFRFQDPMAEGSRFDAHFDSTRIEMRMRGDGGSGIWVTEMGVPVCPVEPTCVSTQNQASWLVSMLSLAEKRPYMRGTVVYSLRDLADPPSDYGQRFGLLELDFDERPAAAALRSAFATPPVATSSTVRTLQVSKTGPGHVSGTSPWPIDCGASCSASLEDGTKQTVIATPSAGHVFDGWSGCDEVSGRRCTVRIAGNRTVNATFLARPKLYVERVGDGGVTSAPAAISCPGWCDAVVDPRTTMTLTAIASPGNTFTGWTGCPSAEGDRCTLTLNSDHGVVANFVRRRSLVVDPRGPGAISGPAGVDCGGSCSGKFDQNELVELTAVSGARGEFRGWTGCPVPQGNRCSLWMDDDRYVVASFIHHWNVTRREVRRGPCRRPQRGDRLRPRLLRGDQGGRHGGHARRPRVRPRVRGLERLHRRLRSVVRGRTGLRRDGGRNLQPRVALRPVLPPR